MSVDFVLDGFDLEIGISRLDLLKRHERVLDPYLEELEGALQDKGVISDPVIADKNSGVVLDGMHRFEAVSRLGYDKIPVCFVDYRAPEVKLGTWWRKFKGLDLETMKRSAEDSGLELKTFTRKEFDRKIKDRELELYLTSDAEFLRTKSDFDSINHLFESVHSLEKGIVEEGFDLSYEPDDDFLQSLSSENAGILFPRARKSEVVQVSHSEDVFPHKMTRHVVPARPLGIDIPLSWLDEDLEIVNEKMDSKLESANLKEIDPGARFRGREYEEKVVTLEVE